MYQLQWVFGQISYYILELKYYKLQWTFGQISYLEFEYYKLPYGSIQISYRSCYILESDMNILFYMNYI